ncbi:MAG TPA: thrombospondin type 3 repeat-containing protein, partial [Phycisphaerales bacterium]|nr:thrombospondin type 3 repeat-containing protein [Phycisphaerales bacterium]
MKDSRFPRAALLMAPVTLLTAVSAFANNTPQTLPFSQNWSNTSLITTSDDWSGVPGIIGYRGDGLASGTGVDPTTVVADGTGTPVDVNANQANPDTFNTGGVTEFAIANPVVAIKGSSTAKAPFILLHLNCTGATNVTFSCRLRDIDGSSNNSVQPIAVQYRIGASGNFSNARMGFVADASSGPNLATQKTIVISTLPAAVNNQPLVEIRILTTDAAGADEWIGIDDIYVTSGLQDSDGDGIPNGTDNCPSNANPTQADCDDNGIGDACDGPCPGDQDGDGIPDTTDNCPSTFNPGQEDCDNNGIGDVCESQPDCNLNGIPDNCEDDCNMDLIADSCDITLGISQDCNLNGI